MIQDLYVIMIRNIAVAKILLIKDAPIVYTLQCTDPYRTKVYGIEIINNIEPNVSGLVPDYVSVAYLSCVNDSSLPRSLSFS